MQIQTGSLAPQSRLFILFYYGSFFFFSPGILFGIRQIAGFLGSDCVSVTYKSYSPGQISQLVSLVSL